MLNIIEIHDAALPELDVFARLTEAQLRNRQHPEQGLFIAESPKVIERALNAGYEPVSLLMERRHITGDAAGIIERCKDIPIYTAERDVLAGLTGYELTRGVLCALRRPALPAVEDLCRNARRVAVLESIVDPTNVGAIFRRTEHGRRSGHSHLLRSPVPPQRAGQHGHGVPDSLDPHWQNPVRLAGDRHGTAAEPGLQNRCHGPQR